VWTMLLGGSAGPYAELASVPGSDFLRTLPMAFIAVGVLGVLTAHWTIAGSVVKPQPTASRPQRRRPARR